MVFNFQQFQQISIKFSLFSQLDLLWIILCKASIVSMVYLQTQETWRGQKGVRCYAMLLNQFHDSPFSFFPCILQW
jgi:hypothetical protein